MAAGAEGRPSVFISYARRSAAEAAVALHGALARVGVPTFLDTQDLTVGDRVPEGVFERLLGARVVVVFADTAYFTRRYCVEELATALSAYRALGRRGAGREQMEEAVRPVVVALPSDGEQRHELERLPPEVRSTYWPPANQSVELADLVRSRLGRVEQTIGGRLERLGELAQLRERLYESIAIPQPRLLGAVRVYHETGLPPSIGDAFVGRARELWELHTALASAQGGVAALTSALEGSGGFGKTRLALEYLHRYGPEAYPGGLYWVNAEVAEDRLEAQLHAILRLVRPEVPELAAFRESGRAAARELGEALREVAAKKPALYVVDNVPEPEAGGRPQDVTRWCPAPGQVSLLLTSRASRTSSGWR